MFVYFIIRTNKFFCKRFYSFNKLTFFIYSFYLCELKIYLKLVRPLSAFGLKPKFSAQQLFYLILILNVTWFHVCAGFFAWISRDLCGWIKTDIQYSYVPNNRSTTLVNFRIFNPLFSDFLLNKGPPLFNTHYAYLITTIIRDTRVPIACVPGLKQC